ncbi:beta-glucan synthesis-associated protein [Elasticomyces elasticus]|nr:beta-glucan synthesis-associated protein [Elasticomyces elasticus]
MSSSSSSPPPRHEAPHIRLNSGNEDIFNMAAPASDQSQQDRPQTARRPSQRSLIAQRPGTAPSLMRQPSGKSLYQLDTPAESAELLLPPRRSRTRRFRDDDSPLRSPSQSGFNSRRTSWSSESAGSRDSRTDPFASPFDGSRAPSRAGSDDDGINTQTVSEKYNILPSAGLLLFPEDVEKDDWLHNPDPNEKEGRMTCADLFSKRGLTNVGGLALITLGVFILFVVYPALTSIRKAMNPAGNACSSNPNCLKEDVPLLKNIRAGLIDPDTPKNVRTRKGVNGKTQKLVFSDEFNVDGRVFYDGDDPYFQGVDLWYGVTMDLEVRELPFPLSNVSELIRLQWYDPDAITTENGTLNIRFDAFQNHGLNYRSGMLQSWNKLCFKGGYLEASISLPGRGDTIGFWPGFWAMGNLGRPGYAATTEGMWPYSYHDKCDAGITNNQSNPDGLSSLPGMRLPACTCAGEDHPSPGKSRSVPEIDAIEASVGYLDPPVGAAIGSASQSYQVAPFDMLWRPNTEFIEVYDRSISSMNSYQGGAFQQALSTVTNLHNDWYDGKAYQKYAFEYGPGADGYVKWWVGDTATWMVTGDAIGPNGNIGQRVMPQEPMAIVANFGMSNGFASLNLTGLGPLMPATMRFDYIRIYQDENGEMTCDPQGYPSTDYIRNHAEAYNNPNLTQWHQTSYSWPRNSFVNTCS